MPDSLPNNLIEQLQDPEPKARRRAVRRLAATRDPSAIPLLRNVYLQDGDDRVRDAAEAALVQFRAMQHNASARRSLGTRLLTWAVAALAIVFVGLLAANIAIRALDQKDGESSDSAQDMPPVLDRAEFEHALGEQFALTRDEVARLRESDRVYRETGALACDTSEHLPAPLELTDATRQNYERDLTLLADRFALTLNALQSAATRWGQMCAAGQANMADLVSASAELDQVTVDLDLLERDLASAIANPAPTFGPSPTPTATETLTPPPSSTPDATLDGEMPVAPPPDAPPSDAPTEVATIPPQPSATATLTPSPAPTATPTPTPTVTSTPLPPPDIDYTAVLKELNGRLAVLGDLQRPYNNGMLDNWQRSQQGEILSTLSCALDPWSGLYEWTPDQRAQLDRADAADPQLEEAVRLINEGLRLAYEARAIYEPSCYNQTLAGTAAEGMPLAAQAQEHLLEAQQLVEQIRRRPSH